MDHSIILLGQLLLGDGKHSKIDRHLGYASSIQTDPKGIRVNDRSGKQFFTWGWVKGVFTMSSGKQRRPNTTGYSESLALSGCSLCFFLFFSFLFFPRKYSSHGYPPSGPLCCQRLLRAGRTSSAGKLGSL